MWVVAASVVCIAALAVPVAVALSSSGPTAKPAKTASSHLTRGVAEQQVISALSATTSSGSFNVSYEFDPPTPPRSPRPPRRKCRHATSSPSHPVRAWRVASQVASASDEPSDVRGVQGTSVGRRPPRARSPRAAARSIPTPSRWSPCRTCQGSGRSPFATTAPTSGSSGVLITGLTRGPRKPGRAHRFPDSPAWWRALWEQGKEHWRWAGSRARRAISISTRA